LILSAALAGTPVHPQISPEQQKQVRGIVVNSATREPIGHALVYSIDRRFATLTDDQGHFQFDVPPEAPVPRGNEMAEVETRTMDGSNGVGSFGSVFPYMLVARKPGFLSTDKVRSPWDTTIVEPGNAVTIALVPEARGDLERAEALFDEALTVARSVPGPRGEEMVAGNISNLGDIAKARGQNERARELCTEAFEMFQRLGVTKWKANFEKRFAELERGKDGEEI